MQPLHRRGWGSVYDALAAGRLDVDALRATLAQDPVTDRHPVYAVDLSVWPRCDAEASPARGFYYHPSRHSAGQPIVAGWAYQWLAQLSFTRDSWTAPLDVRRVHPSENAHTVAVEQITALIALRPRSAATPLFVFDAGYDSAHLTQALAELPVAILVRLRADRCFYADPPPATPSPQGGRPRKHGAKFACRDPTTWPAPTTEHRVEDEQYGTVRVRAWAGLHPKQQAHPGRGTRKPRPIVRGTVVLVEVSRLPARAYPPQLLWLWWAGPSASELDLLWRAYVRRFDLEHSLRFCKQSLGWTTPRVRHPEDLVLVLDNVSYHRSAAMRTWGRHKRGRCAHSAASLGAHPSPAGARLAASLAGLEPAGLPSRKPNGPCAAPVHAVSGHHLLHQTRRTSTRSSPGNRWPQAFFGTMHGSSRPVTPTFIARRSRLTPTAARTGGWGVLLLRAFPLSPFVPSSLTRTHGSGVLNRGSTAISLGPGPSRRKRAVSITRA